MNVGALRRPKGEPISKEEYQRLVAEDTSDIKTVFPKGILRINLPHLPRKLKEKRVKVEIQKE